MRDLVVVGGGPAGLATGLHAARAGLDVVVLESRAGTVDKACGEGLMPGALAALLDLDVDPPGPALTGIRYVSGRRQAQAAFREGVGRGVRRTALHGALREATADAGVPVEQHQVREVCQDGAGVVVDGLHARWLVAADGLHSPLRRSLGLEGPSGRHRRFGLRRHYAVSPWSDHVEVHWGRSAEVYLTPVAADQVGVAVLSATRGGYDEHLAAFPEILARLRGAAPASDVRGAGPLRRTSTARTSGRALLVGDAAGYVDALTGEGVALALAQAGAAVEAVVAGDTDRYEREWVRITRRYRWMTEGLVQATRVPGVRRGLVPLAQALPPVFAAAVGALARPA